MSEPDVKVPDTATVRRDLSRVLGAAIAGHPVEDAPVAWPEVFALARRHQLDPFLAGPVAAWPDRRRPPPIILEKWRRSLLTRAVDAVRIQDQLAEALSRLKQAGVATIPLKGAWLAEHVYEDIIRRPMADLDLLIRPEDVDPATRVLEACGYEFKAVDQPGGWSKERGFRHPQRRAGVELQWRLWHPTHGKLPPVDEARLWKASVPGMVAGVEVPVLRPASHLMYLAYHIQAHLWFLPVRAYLDIVLLGRRYAAELSTGELASEADIWGLSVRAPFVWQVAHEICGVSPPGELAAWGQAAADPIMAPEREAAKKLILGGGVGDVVMSRRLTEFRRGGPGLRLASGLAAVCVSPAQIRHAHPLAVRRGGLAGGYAARLADLLRRRGRDLAPSRQRRAMIAASADNMALRLHLEKKLAEREVPRRA